MTTHSRILMAGVALLVAVAAGWSPVVAAPDTEFQGVWRTAEVSVPGAPGSPSQIFKPAATLAIFHGRHYSRVEVHADRPRTPLPNAATASADEIRAVWGPFVGEAGTFELTGNNTITMHASVAKNPADMQDGAASVYTYRRAGDSLTLTQVRTAVGPSANPITVTLRRVE